ncbi:hypothetical protein GCM10007183_03850 [Staphylococcus muscae]|uniref:Uncharacterized protein n=1 Tax=Staphylococcus muscae TaxID=1294 RepID=A0ABQ1HLZ9_9STAP|nr:hypothetical protein GCM10007183_03850 [Staphylococcus muscae]
MNGFIVIMLCLLPLVFVNIHFYLENKKINNFLYYYSFCKNHIWYHDI